jgi:hypothetical protein
VHVLDQNFTDELKWTNMIDNQSSYSISKHIYRMLRSNDYCHLERTMVIGNNKLIKSNKLIKLIIYWKSQKLQSY